MRGSRTIRTAKNRRAILAALAEGWSVHAAAHRAGIGYSSLFDWRRDDTQFAAEVEAAMEAATDLLEDEARRRAMDQSDLLLIFLLKARRPHIFNRKMLTIAGDPAKPIGVEHRDGIGGDGVYIVLPDNGRGFPPNAQPAVIDRLSIEGGADVEGDAADAEAVDAAASDAQA